MGRHHRSSRRFSHRFSHSRSSSSSLVCAKGRPAPRASALATVWLLVWFPGSLPPLD